MISFLIYWHLVIFVIDIGVAFYGGLTKPIGTEEDRFVAFLFLSLAWPFCIVAAIIAFPLFLVWVLGDYIRIKLGR